jgi:hypothetical protein
MFLYTLIAILLDNKWKAKDPELNGFNHSLLFAS